MITTKQRRPGAIKTQRLFLTNGEYLLTTVTVINATNRHWRFDPEARADGWLSAMRSLTGFCRRPRSTRKSRPCSRYNTSLVQQRATFRIALLAPPLGAAPEGVAYLARNRWFESISLHRRVYCEPEFSGGHRINDRRVRERHDYQRRPDEQWFHLLDPLLAASPALWLIGPVK